MIGDGEKARRGTLRPSRMVRPQRRQVHAPAVEGTPPPRAYVAIAERYAAAVTAGTITAGQWVTLACARHARDKARASADRRCPFIWSPSHARAACAFLERLPHVEGDWSSATLRLQPWQCFLIASLFGWRQRAQPERRRFTTVYLEVGRKNAKSTIMAGIALYHLLHEQERGAQVVCGATTGSQARIAFGIAQRMVQRSPALREAGLQAFANAIITGDGTMKPVNAKASTQDGLNPSCIILDESHAQTFALHDVLKSAQGARRNPLLLCPTTAGYDLLSVGYALRTTVTKVLQQIFEADHVLGLIYTIDEGDDWRDPAVWPKANPMLGITPTREWVTQYCLDAQQTPGLEGEFRVKVCSEWLRAASAWLSITQWDACADPTLRLEQFAGRRCWIGGDLSQSDDIAALALVFERGEELCAIVRGYLPRDVVEARARTVPEYRAWVARGDLVLTDGNFVDVGQIEADLRGWCKTFNVQAIRCDQYGSAGLVSNLERSGHKAAILDKNKKSFTPPSRELEARVKGRRFRHDGSSFLRWQAGNVVVSRGVDDSLLPKKDHPESPNKIDAIEAILLALSAWITPPEVTPSYRIYTVSP
jgi:phage terminase large subunit-like protein